MAALVVGLLAASRRAHDWTCRRITIFGAGRGDHGPRRDRRTGPSTTCPTGDTIQALGYAVQACLVVLALAIGLAVARMLTDRTWGLER